MHRRAAPRGPPVAGTSRKDYIVIIDTIYSTDLPGQGILIVRCVCRVSTKHKAQGTKGRRGDGPRNEEMTRDNSRHSTQQQTTAHGWLQVATAHFAAQHRPHHRACILASHTIAKICLPFHSGNHCEHHFALIQLRTRQRHKATGARGKHSIGILHMFQDGAEISIENSVHASLACCASHRPESEHCCGSQSSSSSQVVAGRRRSVVVESSNPT
jgi:hypothetical protein